MKIVRLQKSNLAISLHRTCLLGLGFSELVSWIRLLIHVIRVSCVRVMLMIMMCILVIMFAAQPIIVGIATLP